MSVPVSSLPRTSSAVNIQIIEPKNFPGGAVPGQISQPGAAAQAPAYGSPYGQAPGYNPAQFYGNPQQQLQQAYQNAMNSRNAAEQARNAYLNLANQLNSQAYQQQSYQQPQPYSQFGYSPYGQQYPVYQPGQYNQAVNQPYMPNYGYPGYYPQQYQNAYNPYQQYQQYPQQQQPYTPQQPPQQQQPPAAPAQQQPQQPQQPDLTTVPIEQLNQMIASPKTLQEKVDAMEALGLRGDATPETYQLLAQEALADTSQLTGQQQDDANYIRQAALWTMGMLNKAQNGQMPGGQLPGINAIEQVIRNKNENPDVKAAAVQALQVINRPDDKKIKKILKKAAKDKNPDVKRLAKDALAGKGIPLPGSQGGNLLLMA